MVYLFTGIIAAVAHVLSGPDHLAAVTPLAIESKNRSWRIGLAWGIGHTLGILIIGLLFLLFRDFIPVEKISEHSEQLVGLMLILIGVWAISKAWVKKISGHHVHPHVHKTTEGEIIHIHGHQHSVDHSHESPVAHAHQHLKQHRQNARASLGIGIFHGLAGVSHLLAILPTLALPTNFDAAMYLTGFGGGTVAAMVAFSAMLGFISQQTSVSGKKGAFKTLRIIGGIAAIIVGLWWIYSSF
ncbi:MAG: sulfite exporter TauE/SafE family protein [Bacteroidales bacterium]|nr:sulfite exporter TauE/SafE family protein [Bacteroidales bacterium]